MCYPGSLEICFASLTFLLKEIFLYGYILRHRPTTATTTKKISRHRVGMCDGPTDGLKIYMNFLSFDNFSCNTKKGIVFEKFVFVVNFRKDFAVKLWIFFVKAGINNNSLLHSESLHQILKSRNSQYVCRRQNMFPLY